MCEYINNKYIREKITTLPWEQLKYVELVETVTANPCKESTYVKACWDKSMLYFQFHCVDHYIRSDYQNHDDPLYEQDVIEIFIDEYGTGKQYIELEVSPHNVIFDAMIENDGTGKISNTQLDFNIAGLVTEVFKSQSSIDYYIGIPLSNFKTDMLHGRRLKVNFYRIDEDQAGMREYQAWGPTGMINYHLPQYFNTLILQ